MSKFVVFATWDDCPHLSAEAKAGLVGSYLPHERDARTKGIPSLGAGAIYPVPEEDVLCDPFQIPAFYKHAYGFDVGWKRTAAVFGALDTDTDILYLYAEYYRGQAEPAVHAQAILSKGDWIPGVIDPAARASSQHDGEQLLTSYRRLGLNRLSVADNAVGTGIYEMWSRMSSGRLKVFRTMQNWLAEFRIYRRDEKGKIVKENDHLMDATRYLVVSGVPIASFRPVEEQKARLGMKPRFEADYNPMAEAYRVGRKTG